MLMNMTDNRLNELNHFKLMNSIIDFNNKIMELESYVLDRGEAVTTTNLINFEGQNKVVLVNYPLGRYELKYDVLGNIYEAFLKAAYVEELAELYHHVLTMNDWREPASFTQDELRKWKYPSPLA